MNDRAAPYAKLPSPRRRGTIAAVLAVVAFVVIGLMWADAPPRRKRVLFEAPIRLVAGTTVSGEFLPEHEGPVALAIRFPRVGKARFDRLAALIGGEWGFETPSPMGLSVSYSVSSADSEPGSMKGVPRYRGERSGQTDLSVSLVWFESRQVPSRATIRIDSAVAGLAEFDATFVVLAAGDWVNYEWLEGAVRGVFVCLGGFIALLVIGIVRMVSVRRFRRAQQRNATLAT